MKYQVKYIQTCFKGLNPATGVSWEEELCGGTGAQGLVYIGDSVRSGLIS